MTDIPLGQAVILGTVQGLTEFLPISSSAHLTLLPWFCGWKDPGLVFDVALHLGTLAAVTLYFFRDWIDLIFGAMANPRSAHGRLLGLLVLATIPAAVAGLTLEDYAETVFREPSLTALMLIAFGLLLGLSRRIGSLKRGLRELGWGRALWVGLAQALAIVPGVSRSGVTLTAGFLAGLNAETALRFSFLMSTPIIAGAALHQLRHLGPGDLNAAFWVGILASGVSGVAAIRFLLAYVQNRGVALFVWYRLALGALILAMDWARR